MKAHLYKQILVSIRLLDLQRTVPIQLREQIDFARILYDKGLFRQSTKILEKAKEQALFYEQYTQAIEIIEFPEKARDAERLLDWSPKRNGQPASRRIVHADQNINELSNSGSQLYGLYLQLGYARYAERPRHDRPGLRPDAGEIRRRTAAFVHRKSIPVPGAGLVQPSGFDMLTCYKYVCRWILLFDSAPHMKRADVRSLPAGDTPGCLTDSICCAATGVHPEIGRLRRRSRLDRRHQRQRPDDLAADHLRQPHQQAFLGRHIRGRHPDDPGGGAVYPRLRDPSWISTTGWCFATKSPASVSGHGDYRKCMDYLGRILSTRAIRAHPPRDSNATPAS